MIEKIKKYFDKNIYKKEHMIAFVQSGVLTIDQYTEIVGETFPEDISVEKTPTDIERLWEENNTLKAKVQALTESNQFLEDCIIEMAEVVYA